MDGNQRPDVVCNQFHSGVSMRSAALSWASNNPLSFYNANCFADPGDQIPGNAPRYFSALRTDGIHNFDVNIYKQFVPKEGTTLEVRAEAFNLFNHPRFGSPDSAFGGNPTFGFVTSTAPGYTPRRFQFGIRFEF